MQEYRVAKEAVKLCAGLGPIKYEYRTIIGCYGSIIGWHLHFLPHIRDQRAADAVDTANKILFQTLWLCIKTVLRLCTEQCSGNQAMCPGRYGLPLELRHKKIVLLN